MEERNGLRGGTLVLAAAAACTPVITQLDPGAGAPGQEVRIRGERLAGSPPEVRFNGTPALVDPGRSDDETIYTFVPQNASTGPVTVDVTAGQATGPQDFQVQMRVAETEPNDTQDMQDELPRPWQGVGTLEPGDVDWFHLDIPEIDHWATTSPRTLRARR